MSEKKSILARVSDAARQRAINWLFPGWSRPMITDEKESKAQNLIVDARKYYGGKHTVKLTERQKKYLAQHSGADLTFTVNHCPTVVDAVIERMKVDGFQVSDAERAIKGPRPLPEPTEDDPNPGLELTPEQKLAAQLWLWWTQNRMDAMQIETHRRMVRDGESFVLVDFDQDRSRPKYILHPRFVDESLGGDGYGMWMDYPNDDPLLDPVRAIKQWVIYREDGTKLYRRVVYWPERIERLQKNDKGEWVPFTDDENGKEAEEEWPAEIGIPVAHFYNPARISELKDIIPLQDALNKTWLDVLAAADTTAFRMLGFLGWIPTTDGKEPEDDGSNLLEVLPGQNIATDRPKDEVDLKIIEPADLTPLLDTEERLVFRMATISDTPAYRFQTSKQIAGSETQKQMDGPLIAKVEERQVIAGNGWENVMSLSLKVSQKFGPAEAPEIPGNLDVEDLLISATWHPAEIRNDEMMVKVAEGKQKIKIPLEQIWREHGYTDAQIAEFKQSPEYQAMVKMREAAILLGESMDERPGDGDQESEDEQ